MILKRRGKFNFELGEFDTSPPELEYNPSCYCVEASWTLKTWGYTLYATTLIFIIPALSFLVDCLIYIRFKNADFTAKRNQSYVSNIRI